MRVSIKSTIKRRSASRRNLQRLWEEYDEYGNMSKFCQAYRYRKDIFKKKLHIKKYLKSMAIQSGSFLPFDMYAQSFSLRRSRSRFGTPNTDITVSIAMQRTTIGSETHVRVNTLIIMPLLFEIRTWRIRRLYAHMIHFKVNAITNLRRPKTSSF